jgi:hypothetical protein
MLLLAVLLICFLLVVVVVLPDTMVTNVLLQLACGPFCMSLSDGRSVGPIHKFSHYAYDGPTVTPTTHLYPTSISWHFMDTKVRDTEFYTFFFSGLECVNR